MDFPLQTDKRQKLGGKLLLRIIIKFSIALVAQTAWVNFLPMFGGLGIILIVLVISWHSIVLSYQYHLINRGFGGLHGKHIQMVGIAKECQPGERKCPTKSYEHLLPPERHPLLSFYLFVLVLLLENPWNQNHYPNIARGKKDQTLHKAKKWSNLFSFRIDGFVSETSLPMCHKKPNDM